LPILRWPSLTVELEGFVFAERRRRQAVRERAPWAKRKAQRKERGRKVGEMVGEIQQKQ
jgi:hypothetical protein